MKIQVLRLQCRKKIDEISSVSEDMTTVLSFFVIKCYLTNDGFTPMHYQNTCLYIGNRLFYFQTITERKIENKKLGGKKRFPQFLLSMYVFCLSVIALQTSSFDIGV